MAKRAYGLIDDYVAPEIEQGVLAALVVEPALYWQLDLSADVFTQERRDVFASVKDTIEAERPARVPDGWGASTDPVTDAAQLVDLYRRRRLAELIERSAGLLTDPATSADRIAGLLEKDGAEIQGAIREEQRTQLVWASDLLGGILHDAGERRRQRMETGKPVLGIPTSIPKLDAILGGLDAGLILLAGAPGAGKTTFAMQVAQAAALAGHPVIYVTFENSPASLVLKAIAGRSGQTPRDVQRGYADLAKLQEAADAWRAIAGRIAIVEGSSTLTIDQLQAKTRQGLNRHKADKALIIVDYLQLWAKASGELGRLGTVRERVETLGGSLREVAMRLNSPVLAIASQNRASGDYGDGKGKASLDSLKESGDLEYAADAALFLTPAQSRTVTAPARAIDLTVAKNRHGETGYVPLLFRPDLATMEESTGPTLVGSAGKQA